jgi:hypothetical protein
MLQNSYVWREDVERLKRQHFQWSKIDVFKNIMKFKLPLSIPLMPQWHPYPIQRIIGDGGELWNASFYPHFDF